MHIQQLHEIQKHSAPPPTPHTHKKRRTKNNKKYKTKKTQPFSLGHCLALHVHAYTVSYGYKGIATDQRTSRSCRESIGLCKIPSMEHMAGSVAAKAPTILNILGKSYHQSIPSQQLHTYQGKLTAQLLWHGNR